MTGNATRHVLAHSMWRTGSTALAKCFLNNDAYLVFYEPFHSTCGSLAKIEKAHIDQQHVTARHLHPDWLGGYFDTYKLVDPKTGKPLFDLYSAASEIENVYTGAVQDTLDYIDACMRVAEEKNKKAFFGFCRSGFQQAQLAATENRSAFYLYRDPISQFLSYRTAENSYYLTSTMLQLLHSKSLFPILQRLIDTAVLERGFSSRTWRSWVRKPDKKKTERVVRKMAQDDAYLVFYLSHLATLRQAEALGSPIFSVDALSTDTSAKAAFETEFDVSLATLNTNTRTVPDAARFDELQDRVEQACADANFGFAMVK